MLACFGFGFRFFFFVGSTDALLSGFIFGHGVSNHGRSPLSIAKAASTLESSCYGCVRHVNFHLFTRSYSILLGVCVNEPRSGGSK